MLRIEMLHQHERHAGVEREMLEQLRERLQPAGRGADAHDRERRASVPRSALAPGIVDCRQRFRDFGTVVRHEEF